MGNEKEWGPFLLSSEERVEIVKQLGISPSTLSRWTTGKSKPRDPQHIRVLARIVPHLKGRLQAEFPDAFDGTEIPREVQTTRVNLQMPRAYMVDIIRDICLIAEYVNQYTVSNKVFEYLISQIDPNDEGFVILPFLCVPPVEGGKVECLRNVDGYGTGLWKFQQVECPISLGKESLSGMAVSRLRPALYPHHHALSTKNPALHMEKIQSAIAYPLLRRGNVAGALFCASIHPNFFDQSIQDLCETYSLFYAMGLFDSQFYAPDRIELQNTYEERK